MSKRPALGRGLASLIPGAETTDSRSAGSDEKLPSESTLMVPLDQLDAGKMQPRAEFDSEALDSLADSIREKGIIQPIIVRKNGARYELIAGERRMRAAKAAGLTQIPAIVRNVNDQESLELALVENIQRDDLNAIELARAFRQLQEDFNYTQEEVSRRVGKDRSTITNHLRLLKLPNTVKQALITEQISMGHARALLGLENDALQEAAFSQILAKGLSVREAEKLVNRLKRQGASAEPVPVPSLGAEVHQVTDRLRRVFQTQVKILTKKSGGGEIRIEYYNPEELNRILELIPEP